MDLVRRSRNFSLSLYLFFHSFPLSPILSPRFLFETNKHTGKKREQTMLSDRMSRRERVTVRIQMVKLFWMLVGVSKLDTNWNMFPLSLSLSRLLTPIRAKLQQNKNTDRDSGRLREKKRRVNESK